MDLSDSPPTLAIRDEVSLDAEERGAPQKMLQADWCNVDLGSLLALSVVPERLSDRYGLGDVDPETMYLAADLLC